MLFPTIATLTGFLLIPLAAANPVPEAEAAPSPQFFKNLLSSTIANRLTNTLVSNNTFFSGDFCTSLAAILPPNCGLDANTVICRDFHTDAILNLCATLNPLATPSRITTMITPFVSAGTLCTRLNAIVILHCIAGTPVDTFCQVIIGDRFLGTCLSAADNLFN